jgi:hypothetical protein
MNIEGYIESVLYIKLLNDVVIDVHKSGVNHDQFFYIAIGLFEVISSNLPFRIFLVKKKFYICC